MRPIMAVAALLVLVGTGGAQDDAKTEMTRLEGEWSMVSGGANELPMPKETVKGGRRVSDAVGEMLISNPTVADRQPSFKFYI